MESILNSIKKLLGITAEDTSFDTDIIIHINTVFLTLNQLGVGPNKPVAISSELDTWVDKFGAMDHIEAIKSYTYLRVRLLFDQPTSSFVVESMNKQITELEWRLMTQLENNKED